MNIKRLGKDEETELAEFTREVVSKYRDIIELIELFGSAVRGELQEDSDLDLLIVVKTNPFKVRKGFVSLATEMCLKYGRLISLKIYDKEQYDYLNYLETPFMKNIEKEGKILWKRK